MVNKFYASSYLNHAVLHVWLLVYLMFKTHFTAKMIELRHPTKNHTVPITYPSNITYECTVSEGLDAIWNVATGQYLSGVRTQLPLEGIQLQSNETISSFEEKGIYVPVSSLQNSTRLIISQKARQHNSLIQVQCISFNPATLARRFTGFYYVITYCK